MNTMLRRRAMMAQGGTPPTPPLPYTPVDYIETDGTAYINTGIKGNAPMSVQMKVTPVAPASGNKYILGCRKDSGNTRFLFLLVSYDKKAGIAYYSGAATSINIADSCDNNTPMGVVCSLKSGQQKLQIKQEGESSYTTDTRTTSGAVTTNTDMYLFCWNNQGTPSAPQSGTRVWYVKIFSDSTFTNLVFDGRACSYNGQYGLWDMVSDTFFGNAAGSGAFSGPQI